MIHSVGEIPFTPIMPSQLLLYMTVDSLGLSVLQNGEGKFRPALNQMDVGEITVPSSPDLTPH
jgi:hypothetical protein